MGCGYAVATLDRLLFSGHARRSSSILSAMAAGREPLALRHQRHRRRPSQLLCGQPVTNSDTNQRESERMPATRMGLAAAISGAILSLRRTLAAVCEPVRSHVGTNF